MFEILSSRAVSVLVSRAGQPLSEDRQLALEASLCGAGRLTCEAYSCGSFRTHPYLSGSQGANVYVFPKENQIKIILSKIKSVGGNT